MDEYFLAVEGKGTNASSVSFITNYGSREDCDTIAACLSYSWIYNGTVFFYAGTSISFGFTAAIGFPDADLNGGFYLFYPSAFKFSNCSG